MTPTSAVVFAMLRFMEPSLDAARSPDACLATIPASLRAAAAVAFPTYRLPRRADNLDEDIDYYKKQGHGDCLGATQGDFDGDGEQDFGILLTAVGGDDALLVAAMRQGRTWHFQKLRAFPKSEGGNLYVVTATPGEYKTFEQRQQLEPGEVNSFRSQRQGIVTGTTESSAVSYFWTPTGWIHVWVMN